MSHFFAYLQYDAIAMAITLLSNMSTNAVIICETFFLSRSHAKPGRLLLGIFLISLAQMLPIFIHHAFIYPADSGIVAYSVLTYPLPLMLPLYYWVYRRVFHAPENMSLVFMEWVLLCQYIVMLIYRLMNAVWTTLLEDYWTGLNMFSADVPAMVSTSVIAWITWIALRGIVKRTGHYMQLSREYPLEEVKKTLPSTVVSCLINYLMLVFSSIALVANRHPDATYNVVWVYLLMLCLQAYWVIDQYLTKRLAALEWQKKVSQLYTDSLVRALDELRGIKHDFGNILQVYGGYISTQDLQGLNSYHASVMGEMQHIGGNMALVEALRPRTALYHLLSMKLHVAQRMGVVVEVTEVGALCEVGVEDLDLCRILGNLMDNAIEAAMESAERRVVLSCRRESVAAVLVAIGNSYSQQPDAARLFDPGYTTKPGHSGRGLCIVRDLLLDRDCGTLYTDQDGRTFTAHLRLWISG